MGYPYQNWPRANQEDEVYQNNTNGGKWSYHHVRALEEQALKELCYEDVHSSTPWKVRIWADALKNVYRIRMHSSLDGGIEGFTHSL